MNRYRTKDGDMIDAICKAHYGREDMLEAVMAANHGLARHGPKLPAGLEVILPEDPQASVKTTIKLWGST